MPEARAQSTASVPPDVVMSLLRQAGTTIEAELRGRSMAGTFEDRTRLRIVCADGPAPRLGDIVAFRAADSLTVHRVVARGPGGADAQFVLTRGDGAVLPDHPVTRAQILGIVREWRDGDAWRPVPDHLPTGWRGAVARAILWPVAAALQVHPRLAFALTFCGFHARAAWQTVARRA